MMITDADTDFSRGIPEGPHQVETPDERSRWRPVTGLLGATLGVDIAAAVKAYEETMRAAWALYEETERPALALYRETRRAALALYGETKRAALALYGETKRATRTLYEETERAAWALYEETRRAARTLYEETRRTAREQLLKDVTGDPLAVWIVEHAMPLYHNQAITVLRALPATLSHLNRLADNNNWCDAWSAQVAAARVAGAIPAEADS